MKHHLDDLFQKQKWPELLVALQYAAQQHQQQNLSDEVILEALQLGPLQFRDDYTQSIKLALDNCTHFTNPAHTAQTLCRHATLDQVITLFRRTRSVELQTHILNAANLQQLEQHQGLTTRLRFVQTLANKFAINNVPPITAQTELGKTDHLTPAHWATLKRQLNNNQDYATLLAILLGPEINLPLVAQHPSTTELWKLRQYAHDGVVTWTPQTQSDWFRHHPTDLLRLWGLKKPRAATQPKQFWNLPTAAIEIHKIPALLHNHRIQSEQFIAIALSPDTALLAIDDHIYRGNKFEIAKELRRKVQELRIKTHPKTLYIPQLTNLLKRTTPNPTLAAQILATWLVTNTQKFQTGGVIIQALNLADQPTQAEILQTMLRPAKSQELAYDTHLSHTDTPIPNDWLELTRKLTPLGYQPEPETLAALL